MITVDNLASALAYPISFPDNALSARMSVNVEAEMDPINVGDEIVMRVSDRLGEASKLKIFQVVEMSVCPRSARTINTEASCRNKRESSRSTA